MERQREWALATAGRAPGGPGALIISGGSATVVILPVQTWHSSLGKSVSTILVQSIITRLPDYDDYQLASSIIELHRYCRARRTASL
jgi:hypothetical protein